MKDKRAKAEAAAEASYRATEKVIAALYPPDDPHAGYWYYQSMMSAYGAYLDAMRAARGYYDVQPHAGD